MTGGCYRYCGLILDSSLDLPELPAAPETGAAADLTIRRAPEALPEALPDAIERTDTFEHNGREALWRLAGVARYRVSGGGRLIEVAPDSGADPASVRLFLLSPVFALASVLRGDWMLNAAAVARNGRVSAFIGPSASGKSTAAAVLLQRGWDLVSDSLLRVTFGPDGRPLAHPQAPWQWLWPDAAERLDVDLSTAEPLRPGIGLRRVTRSCVDDPLPLTRVAVLREQKGDDLELFESGAQPGRHALELLLRHVAGNTWLEVSRVQRPFFLWGTRLAASTEVLRLDIPWGWRQLDTLGAHLAAWGAEGVCG